MNTEQIQSRWVRTAARLPGEPGEQTDILMWSPEWATWLKGMVTRWMDGTCEWAIYNQQDDRYHEWDYPPEFWMSPILPHDLTGERPSVPAAGSPSREFLALQNPKTKRWVYCSPFHTTDYTPLDRRPRAVLCRVNCEALGETFDASGAIVKPDKMDHFPTLAAAKAQFEKENASDQATARK